VPTELWNAIGALLIVTAMLATHPIKPAVAQRIESQIAMNWTEVQKEQATCPADLPCFPIQVQ
jgi:hypothetical protein